MKIYSDSLSLQAQREGKANITHKNRKKQSNNGVTIVRWDPTPLRSLHQDFMTLLAQPKNLI